MELSAFLQDEYLENPLLDYSGDHDMAGGREDIGQTYEQAPLLERSYEDTVEEEDRRRKDIPMPEQADIKNYILEQIPAGACSRELAQDDLTKLRSRRGFFDYVETLFTQPQKLKNAAIVMIDADGLKKVNDTYGHNSGDAYLRAIGDVLKNLGAPGQVTARLSGDEFAVFLYGMESRSELAGWLKCLELLWNESKTQLDSGETIRLSFSFGAGYYREDGTDCRLMLQTADTRVYEDKKARKVQREA